MVINSTNINKTNNHLEIILSEITKHKNDYEYVAGLKQLKQSQSSPLNNWISNGNTYINKRKKKPCSFTSPQKDHILSQKWMTT